jgi:hypothetical protein
VKKISGHIVTLQSGRERGGLSAAESQLLLGDGRS